MSDSNAEAVELDVARARAGDRSALESVVRAIQKEVYQLALRFLGHPQDAEDATQEILIRIVTGLDGFRGKSAFPNVGLPCFVQCTTFNGSEANGTTVSKLRAIPGGLGSWLI